MKRFILFLSVFSILILNNGFSEKDKAYTVSLFVGDVRVSHNSGVNWNMVEAEMELKEADTIKTGMDSFCDILMPGRGNFRVVDNTIVTINKLKKQLEEIKVKKGKALFTISKKLKSDETFRVESDIAVAAVRGTEFLVETDGEKLKYSVVKGKVLIRRNVKIPVEDTDEELVKSIEVEADANQELELTLDENKDIEATLERAKNNLSELKEILSNTKKDTQKKIRLMKNADRVLKEINKYEETQNNSGEGNEEDETGGVIDKAKKHSR